MNRFARLFITLAAAAALLVPVTGAQAQKSDKLCDRNPKSPLCEKAREREQRREEAKDCAGLTQEQAKAKLAKAKAKLKKAKKKLRKAKASLKAASGDKAKAKAKKKVKKAKKKVKKAKKKVKKAKRCVD